MISKTIGSFKLHKKGEAGIEITAEQFSGGITKENADKVYHDSVNTFRKEQVPAPILSAIGRLKYFFMNICGYWIDLYDQYLDEQTFLLTPVKREAKKSREVLENLWDSISVTQVKIDSTSFTIMGQIEIIDNKPLNLNPPAVTLNDEFEGYQDARDVINGIIGLLVQYFSTAALSDVKGYRKWLLEHSDESKKQDISKMSEEQIMNQMMDYLAKKGAVVLMDQSVLDGSPVEQEEKEDDLEPEDLVEEEVKSPDVDLEQEPEPEMQEATTGKASSDGYRAQPEKKKDPYGPPAAEDGKTDPVDPEAEFSADMEVGAAVEQPASGTGDLDDVPPEEFE